MQVDVRKIAEELIMKLWSDSEKLKDRAEGVKLLYESILKAGEQVNGQQDNLAGREEKQEKQETQE